jgi:general transcription factor IIIA
VSPSPQPLKNGADVKEDGFLKLEDDELDYQLENDGFSEDDLETAETPITPFSPGRKKFPSELKTIKCTVEGCPKTFNRPARLASHLRSHANVRPFVCNFDGCDKSYIEEKHLKQHVKGSHTHERSYHCDWEGCSKSFLTATRLRRHKLAHEGHDRFRCTTYPPCNETFRKHQTLQRHIRSEHLELAPFQCTHIDPITGVACNAGFDGGSGLRKHEDRVHGMPRYFCPECVIPGSMGADGSALNIGFTTEAQLQAHIKKEHANCPFCDRRCASQSALEKHIESQHSGTTLAQRKNIPCTYLGCAKTFTKKSNLTVHIRTAHIGERYICGTFDVCNIPDLAPFDTSNGCGKDFVSKANLEDHVRTAHLGLPSVINAKRKRSIPVPDDDDDEYNPAGTSRKRRKGKKIFEQPSAFDELTGAVYDDDERRTIPCTVPGCRHKFMREYDLEVHLRTKQHNPPATSANMESNTASMADQAFLSRGLIEEDGAEANLGGMYSPAFTDWEMQEQALAGGPFWVGADAMAGSLPDQWAQDEMDMRRLIDAGESGFADAEV